MVPPISLRVLKNQNKANAASVPTLGGGKFGHLRLILDATSYNDIAPNTPFIAPTQPGVLNIPAGNVQQLITILKQLHEKECRIFYTCQGVEGTLKQQVAAAFDHDI